MENKEEMLKQLALKTMFRLNDDEISDMISEYDIFMNHVAVLEKIDTTGVEPLAYPYVIETSFLREDIASEVLSVEDVLKNVKEVKDNQVKVPKVVG